MADATTRDTRSKGLAITALVLAGLGLILAFVGFIPVPVVGLLIALLAGLVLLLALVLSIVALASKKQGGKGLGIAALVGAAVGAVIAFFAIGYAAILLLAFGLSDPAGDVVESDADSLVSIHEEGPQFAGITVGGEAVL